MANAITLSRLPILMVVILLLYSAEPSARLASVFLLVILIALDTIDGMVARARNEVSHMGSVLDVMVDRVVELVLWICFADLRLIPVAIPIICVMRGTIVDSLRGMQVSEGRSPLKAARTRLGKWLMGSPFMRTSYGLAKMIAFTGLAVAHTLAARASRGEVSPESAQSARVAFAIVSWIAVAFCLTRGLPAIVEALIMPLPRKADI